MQLYPAIDVERGGLARGASPPDAEARAVAVAGAAWAHVVDIDRAYGRGRNDAAVQGVLTALGPVRAQLGGGLTDPADLADALAWGVARVVLGAGAHDRLGALAAAVSPDKLALAVEVRDGVTVTRGGVPLGVPPARLARQAADAGIRTVVYRDLARDGTLAGGDLHGAGRLVGLGVDVILAGGVRSLDELRAARDLGLAGVIVGRALLDRRFTLAEALTCCG